MSTFSRDNGPLGEEGYLPLLKKIQDLETKIQGLTQQVKYLKSDGTSYDPANGSPTTENLAAVLNALTVTGAMNGAGAAFTGAVGAQSLTASGTVSGSQITSSGQVSANDVSTGTLETTGDVSVGGLIKASNIRLERTWGSGSFVQIGTGTGLWTGVFVLAKLSKDTEGRVLPGTLYVGSNIKTGETVTPEFQAVVQFTEQSCTVTYDNNTGNPSAEPPVPNKTLRYAVWQAGDDVFFGVGFYDASNTQVAPTGSLYCCGINVEPPGTTGQGYITGTEVSYMSCSGAHGTAFMNLAVATLAVSGPADAGSPVASFTGDVTISGSLKGPGENTGLTNITASSFNGGTASFTSLNTSGNVLLGGTLAVTGLTKLNGGWQIVNGSNTYSMSANGILQVAALNCSGEIGGSIIRGTQFNLLPGNVPFARLSSTGSVNNLELGSSSRQLKLQSFNAPQWGDKTIALQEDLSSSIIFRGSTTVWFWGRTGHPTGSIPTAAGGTYTFKDGDTALYGDIDSIFPTQLFTASYDEATSSWINENAVGQPGQNNAYQFNVDYCMNDSTHGGSDKFYYYHEITYSPYAGSQQGRSVFFNVLPLDDYYNREDVDNMTTALEKLATAQADWLDETPELTPGTDDPRYIRNKPRLGITNLDGGNWDAGIPNPYEFAVDGGDFSSGAPVLPGANTVEKTYKNALIQIMRGTEATMPTSNPSNAGLLMFATDTGSLFIDTGTSVEKLAQLTPGVSDPVLSITTVWDTPTETLSLQYKVVGGTIYTVPIFKNSADGFVTFDATTKRLKFNLPETAAVGDIFTLANTQTGFDWVPVTAPVDIPALPTDAGNYFINVDATGKPTWVKQ